MTRFVEEPKVRHDKSAPFEDDEILEHPAFGQISVSRISGHATLYGSDFRHQHYVAVRISTSTLRRGLSHDWPHAGNEIIEVNLSEAQWAAFVSSFNRGEGVQCTISHRDGKLIPGFPLRDEADKYRGEAAKQLGEAMSALKAALGFLGEAKIAKKDSLLVAGQIQKAIREIGVNSDYVRDKFDEHIETRIHKAHIEIEAYMNATIRAAGLEALGISSGNVMKLDTDTMKTIGDQDEN